MDTVRKKAKGTWHHGALREALMAAAVQLIAERGVSGFSLREAARAVGVAVSAVYNHFPDKEGLLVAVAEDGFSRLARAMERALEEAGEEADGARQFEALGRSYVTFALAHPQHFQVMFGEPRPAGAARGVGATGLDPWQLQERVLRQLEQEGRLQLPRAQAALLAWSSVHGLAALLISGRLQAAPEEALSRVTGALLHALVRR